MREIKFRGKRVDNGEWRICTSIEISISGITLIGYEEVTPSTVGQFTGLLDKNGKEIYEGDIMPVYENGEEYTYKVLYDGDCFMLGFIDSEQGSYPLSTKCNISEVIGNIHDNPELLKTENNETI